MVACTGFLNDEIELLAKKAGFDVAIQAPLTPERIDSCIRKVLKAHQSKLNYYKINEEDEESYYSEVESEKIYLG